MSKLFLKLLYLDFRIYDLKWLAIYTCVCFLFSFFLSFFFISSLSLCLSFSILFLFFSWLYMSGYVSELYILKSAAMIMIFLSGNCLCLPPDMRLYDRVYCGASCPESHENYMKGLINVSRSLSHTNV